MRQHGGNAGTPPTRVERWRRRAQDNPFIASAILAFTVLVAFAGGWKQVTGEHLWASVNGMLNSGPQSYDECLEEANDAFMEIMKCKDLFGERP